MKIYKINYIFVYGNINVYDNPTTGFTTHYCQFLKMSCKKWIFFILLRDIFSVCIMVLLYSFVQQTN